jgi:hypothetical protein
LVYTRDLKSLASAYGFESRPGYHIMRKNVLKAYKLTAKKYAKALALLAMMPSLAAAQVATAVAIRGEVMVNGQEIQQGAELDNGDRVVSTNQSFVVLQFTDGSKVTVRPMSEFTIDNYSYMEGEDEARFDLARGGLRIVTGAIAKSNPDNYTLNTPVALMGVRGTEFAIQLAD